MIKNILVIILVCSFFQAQAQEYFQQDVNYDIKVKLIDSIHTLKGEIKITYKNNSPDELSELFMHLWGNAFKNRSTAFAKQKVRTFNTDFYFAEDEELGFYENLDFIIDGKPISWALTEEHIDIARLSLRESLKPGEEITIETPFSLRVHIAA